jgi:hypothetical protein
MAISDDTVAIVAAQLAAAHCAIGPKFTNMRSEREQAKYVWDAYDAYREALEKGGVDHFNPAPRSEA